MLRTIEAVVEVDGNVRLLESVPLQSPRRALVTILDEEVQPKSPPRKSRWAEAAEYFASDEAGHLDDQSDSAKEHFRDFRESFEL